MVSKIKRSSDAQHGHLHHFFVSRLLLSFSGFVLRFNSAPIGFLFLLVVVAEAVLCGFWQATVVSLLASACLDYFFYPPYRTFDIAHPQNWVALGAFELSALVLSRCPHRNSAVRA